MMMNTTNNHQKTSDQATYNNPDYVFNDEDFYIAQNANIDCCILNSIVFTCMIIGIYCLLSYDPNVNRNVKSNLPDNLNLFNKSNNM